MITLTQLPHLEKLDTQSIANFMKSAKVTEDYILQNYQRALAAKFIHYFDEYPDAVLFVHGENHPKSKIKFSQCFVARIDKEYVRAAALEYIQTHRDEYMLNQRLNNDVNYDTYHIDLRQTLSDPYKKDRAYVYLPQCLEVYTQNEFHEFFKIKQLTSAWSLAGNYDDKITDYSGMAYSKKDLPELLPLLGVDYFDFNAQMESEKLSLMVSAQPIASQKIAL